MGMGLCNSYPIPTLALPLKGRDQLVNRWLVSDSLAVLAVIRASDVKTIVLAIN